MKTIATVLVTIIATLAVGPSLAAEAFTPRTTAYWMNRACASEDSNNCYWDAGTSGNGKGHSFYSHKIGKITCVMYTNKGYSKKHDYCY